MRHRRVCTCPAVTIETAHPQDEGDKRNHYACAGRVACACHSPIKDKAQIPLHQANLSAASRKMVTFIFWMSLRVAFPNIAAPDMSEASHLAMNSWKPFCRAYQGDASVNLACGMTGYPNASDDGFEASDRQTRVFLHCSLVHKLGPHPGCIL